MTNVGFREYINIKRPERAMIEQFRGLPVPNIDDNMNRLYAVSPEIVPFNKSPLLGCAFTVKVPAGDNLMFHRALDLAEPGDILVIDGAGGTDRALCGEIMVKYAISRGLGGFIINGCIRDAESLSEMDFPVYAIGVNPNGPYKNGPGEINVPVVAGGVAILPGDILVGDADGIVVIRPQDADGIACNAMAQNEKEQMEMEKIKVGTMERSWVNALLTEKKCETIT
jgi:RraA family protein